MPIVNVKPEQTRYAIEQIAIRCLSPALTGPWAGRAIVVDKVAFRFKKSVDVADRIVNAAVEQLWSTGDAKEPMRVEKELTIVRTRLMLLKVFKMLTRGKVKRKYEPVLDDQKNPVVEMKEIPGGGRVEKPKMKLVSEERVETVDAALFAHYKNLEEQFMQLQGVDKVAAQDAIMRLLVENIEKQSGDSTISIKGSNKSVAMMLKNSPIERIRPKQIESKEVDSKPPVNGNGNGQG